MFDNSKQLMIMDDDNSKQSTFKTDEVPTLDSLILFDLFIYLIQIKILMHYKNDHG